MQQDFETPTRLDKPRRHVAEAKVRIGAFKASSRAEIGTDGLLAVTALVGVILLGTAGIVWAATSPARRRARRHD